MRLLLLQSVQGHLQEAAGLESSLSGGEASPAAPAPSALAAAAQSAWVHATPSLGHAVTSSKLLQALKGKLTDVLLRAVEAHLQQPSGIEVSFQISFTLMNPCTQMS